MRAAVLTEVNKPLQILDLEQEGPKAGEVRVQVKAAGVCMSDYHIMNGDWPLPLPMVLGHGRRHRRRAGPGVHERQGAAASSSRSGRTAGTPLLLVGSHGALLGHNDTPRWRMHNGTARVKLNGEPINQIARIGTFSEYVVCPAEQVVPVRRVCPGHTTIIGSSVATGVGVVVRPPTCKPAAACWWWVAAASASTWCRAQSSLARGPSLPATCSTTSSSTPRLSVPRTPSMPRPRTW